MPKYKFVVEVEVEVESEFTYLKTRDKLLEKIRYNYPQYLPKLFSKRVVAVGSKFIKIHRAF